ncbi:MAG: hypothetical protein M3094_00030 [Actinomycetia bacterium]|nr:hypothetical protein [Actinomycetes bacterium]
MKEEREFVHLDMNVRCPLAALRDLQTETPIELNRLRHVFNDHTGHVEM